MGFSTTISVAFCGPIPVSIPRRDFWVFQQSRNFLKRRDWGVSIPRRDFWVFQLR
ncbi:hypothetical protein CKA32_000709 [Geitlerinema sp. FC II]|nr:hypothetical protein CKA32_000709 [Geitlerinema sp. FC II]